MAVKIDADDFAQLVNEVRINRGLPPISPSSSFLTFDPGHTTGYCIFRGTSLTEAGEIDTSDMEVATREIGALLQPFSSNPKYFFDRVLIEDYRIYRWRKDHHVGSEMLTTRVIGCIETMSAMCCIDVYKQPAYVAKQFCTDKRVQNWGFWQKGQKHANDAIRHACYHLLFGFTADAIKLGAKGSHTVG